MSAGRFVSMFRDKVQVKYHLSVDKGNFGVSISILLSNYHLLER